MFEANPAPPKADINIFFDIISPYSYFAFRVASFYAPSWRSQGYAVHYIPVFQGAIMQASGNSPPMTVPAKAKMGELDTARWAKLLGINLQQPGTFPVNSIHAARLLAVIARYHAAKLPAAMAALWEGYWGGDDGGDGGGRRASETLVVNRHASEITTKSSSSLATTAEHGGREYNLALEQDLKAMLSSVFTGAELDIMLKLAKSSHFKTVVRQNTQQAIDSGAYGVPWIQVMKADGESEWFFGNDRWLHVVRYAGISWDGYAVVGGAARASL